MPDIGNTTIPSPTQRSCNGELRGILITMPEAGTLDSITAYSRAEAGHSMYAYLYDSSGNLLAQSAERTDISATVGYHTFTFSGSPALSDATDYIICVGADSANTAEQYWEGSDVTENTFPGRTTAGFPAFTDATTPPDPAAFSVDASRFFIMYATYTVASGGVALIGIVDETVQASESAARLLGLFRLIADTVGLTEADLHTMGLLRFASESVAVSDAQLRRLGLVRIQADTEGVTETTLTILGLVRLVAETQGVTESVSRLLGLLQLVNETVEVDDLDLELFRDLFKFIDETLGTADGLVRAAGLVRILSETEALTETAVRNSFAALVEIVNESVAISDTDRLLFLGLIRFAAESVGIAEAQLRAMGLVRLIAENEGAAEALIRTLALIRRADETVATTESVSRFKGLVRTVAETVAITEAIVRVVAEQAAQVAAIALTGVWNQVKSLTGRWL